VINKIEQYKKYFSFKDKASRSEYWGVYLISWLLLGVTTSLAFILFVLSLPFTIVVIGLLGWITSLAIICAGSVLSCWLWIATTIRRCNDAGINPWFAVTVLLPPPFGTIPVIIFGCLNTDTTTKKLT
jgi:uncharacterized membrane protein YhaH (DUF805 family)